MGRMNTHLAHDMRTPLQLIYSCAQMIETELNDPGQPASRYAKILMENVQSLKDMLACELDCATGSGDIVQAVRSLCRRMDAEAVRSGVILLFSSNAASFRMRLDQGKLDRILQNLISNALRFTPPGGSVRTDLRILGDTVEISVSDTGPGITPERRKRIFEPGETSGGYGLGLGIARKLARQMGGRLELDPRYENGASFILRLPVKGATR